jgi:hypothetical protein
MGPRYDSSQIQAFAEEFQRDGICILRNHFSKATLEKWRREFEPLLHRQIELEGAQTSRGPHRYYVTLPFVAPFADPTIFEDECILSIVEKLVGQDFTMVQLATDTPLRGSDYQDIHCDSCPLFPEWGRETPPFQLAVNFPLVDVTPENGPFEVVRGTHLLSREEGMQQLERGNTKLEPICLELGDVLIRDVRALHRGTPNQTKTPRPMVVLGYSRKWLYRPEVSIQIPRALWPTLSPRAQRMLRTNPVVERLESAPKVEEYQTFSY